jgi:uncharacterized protein (TIGR03382 family)
MFWFITAAYASIIFSEDDLQDLCVPSGEYPMVIGEVIEAECISKGEYPDGSVITNYGATIQVIEDADNLGLGDTFELHTTNNDYSNADIAPGCSITDPGHPAGEIARYYLSPQVVDGVYGLYDSETFYPTEDSNPDPEPICDSFVDDEEEVDDTEGKADNDEPEAVVETKGCSSTGGPVSAALGLLALLGIVMRRESAVEFSTINKTVVRKP